MKTKLTTILLGAALLFASANSGWALPSLGPLSTDACPCKPRGEPRRHGCDVRQSTWTTADLPFGGIKNSGQRREVSKMCIQKFMNKKLVRVASVDAPAEQ